MSMVINSGNLLIVSSPTPASQLVVSENLLFLEVLEAFGSIPVPLLQALVSVERFGSVFSLDRTLGTLSLESLSAVSRSTKNDSTTKVSDFETTLTLSRPESLIGSENVATVFASKASSSEVDKNTTKGSHSTDKDEGSASKEARAFNISKGTGK